MALRQILFFAFSLLFWLGLETYVYRGLRAVFGRNEAGGGAGDGAASTRTFQWKSGGLSWPVLRLLCLIGVGFVLATIVYFSLFGRPVRASLTGNILVGLSFTFLITKLVFALVLLLEDALRSLHWMYRLLARAAGIHPPGPVSLVSRRRFVTRLGLLLAALPFSTFLYGITRGKYAFHLHHVKLAFPDLPPAFEGLRIVQLSDVHSGSFDDPEALAAGLDLVAEQKADLILFTGDLVNDLAEEVEPYLGQFERLTAPLGKFSVLGNHDYGDYQQWESPEAKEANFAKLHEHHAAMGFDLLKNRHVRLERGGDSLVLAGVENWGKRPFPQFGDLNKALEGSRPDDFVVLMSHDPTHWDAHVLPSERRVHLTMSGHTHGAQMGVEIPGWRWSPSRFVYPRWAGLYREKERYLYVNRGFGFIGFPGRVGIWPEVTVLELSRA